MIPDPDLKALVIDARRSGQSYAAIAKAAGISHMTVKRWCDRAEIPQPRQRAIAQRAARIAEQAAVDAGSTALAGQPLPNDATSIEHTRRWLAECYARVEAMKNDPAGPNWNVITKAMRDAVEIAKLLTRQEKTESSDPSVLHISVSEVIAARERVEAIVEADESRGPLRCADCGRALSVAWGAESAAQPDERHSVTTDTRNGEG